MEFDRDLRSVQEVRDLVRAADAAQREFRSWPQDRVDALVKTVATAAAAQAERLAEMAVSETGFGVAADKVLKNLLGSSMTYDYIKDMKTVGIIREDEDKKLLEVAVPVGVVAALIPSTNPTSTVMYKTLISLKAGCGIVISPHPNARRCIIETARVLQEAAYAAGAPRGLIGCVELITPEAVSALMKHKDIGVILATGGAAMVKAAYSSGNPALGVGPGNGPAFIERTADIPAAVRRIMDSKTFDNGTICASEQSVVTELCSREAVIAEMTRQGAHFMDEEQSKRVGKLIMRSNGTMNPAIVGKPAGEIARMAGITIPPGTRVLVSEQTEVGPDKPYSREKLCPILAFFVEENWERCCELCVKILENEGTGHTMTIHSKNDAIIREFALKKPVSRLLVNTAGALGGVGATTSLAPALTLGCGAVGGSATSDNVSPLNLINIRRAAWGTLELDDLRRHAGAVRSGTGSEGAKAPASVGGITRDEIERITRDVLAAVLAGGIKG